MKKSETCYMCDRQATSVEHVPPQGFFPEGYKKINLMTVPSCSEHNEEKSHEDEAVRNLLTMAHGNNISGKEKFYSKTKKSVDVNSTTFSAIPVTVENSSTLQKEKTMAIAIDEASLHAYFQNMGRALYFAHFKKKYLGKIDVALEFTLSFDDFDRNDDKASMVSGADELFKSVAYHGQNQDIFKYQVSTCDSTHCMRLTFYNAQKVLLAFTG